MNDDVIIGTGNSGSTAISIRAFTTGAYSVSENDVSYWIGNGYLGLGMTIFKNTEEGNILSQLIKEEVNISGVYSWLEDVLLKNISHDKLKFAISNEVDRSFDRGCEFKSEQIRHSLEL